MINLKEDSPLIQGLILQTNHPHSLHFHVPQQCSEILLVKGHSTLFLDTIRVSLTNKELWLYFCFREQDLKIFGTLHHAI